MTSIDGLMWEAAPCLRADERNRTSDLLITKQALYQTELHRHVVHQVSAS